MHLLPYRHETIILPYPSEEAIARLRPLTRPVDKGYAYRTEDERRFLFNGILKKSSFRISRRILKPENFLPLVVGQLENTSVGSLLFVRYRLFFSTAMYLVFWSAVCLLLSLFFLIYHEAWLYASVAFGIGCVQYIIAVKNFSLQVRRSRQDLEKALFGRGTREQQ
jgi:hypothetical protein